MPAIPPPFRLKRDSYGQWFVYVRGSSLGRPATREEIWMWAALKRMGKSLAEAKETREV